MSRARTRLRVQVRVPAKLPSDWTGLIFTEVPLLIPLGVQLSGFQPQYSTAVGIYIVMLCEFLNVSTFTNGLPPFLLRVYKTSVTHQNSSKNMVEFPKGEKMSKYLESRFFTVIIRKKHDT